MKSRVTAELSVAQFQQKRADMIADIAAHYNQAGALNCHTVLWSNEGLFLLNSIEEYEDLRSFFSPYSKQIQAVCVFREPRSFAESYGAQLLSQGLKLSNDPLSYRYLEMDSWLFDYRRKRALLRQVFDECTFMNYDSSNMLPIFLRALGISLESSNTQWRLNVRSVTDASPSDTERAQ